MHNRGLCWRPVSVCPSVTLVYCIQTAEDIVKLFRRPGSPRILFLTPAPIPNSKGNPFSGDAKYIRGWEIFAIFDWNRRLSRNGTRQAHCCYGTLIGNHRWRNDTCWFRCPWVTLNPGFKVTGRMSQNGAC